MLLRTFVATSTSAQTTTSAKGGIFQLLILDSSAIIAVGLIAYLAVRVLFPTASRLDQLAVAVIWGFVRWWVALRIAVIAFRPDAPNARLIPTSDRAARSVVHLLSIGFAMGMWFIAIAPILLGGGLDAPAARALAIVIGVIESLVLLTATWRMSLDDPRPPHWISVALRVTIVSVSAIWIVSVLALEFSAYRSLILSLEFVGIAVIADRLLVIGTSDRVSSYITAARRVTWFATGAVVVFSIAKLVILKVVNGGAHQALASPESSYTKALIIIVAGIAIFEVLRAISIEHFGAGSSAPDPNDDRLGHPVSRVATIVPIAVGAGGTLIIITALIMALSELGVSVAPLIAGAGIIGLAFSFGSQALIRDVVSGMFNWSVQSTKPPSYRNQSFNSVRRNNSSRELGASTYP